jgi:hypothetical protein
MVWVVLVLAAVSWLVVTMIPVEESGRSASVTSRLSARFSGLAHGLADRWPQFIARTSELGRRALVGVGQATRVLAVAVGREAGRAARSARQRTRQRRVATLEPGWSIPAADRSPRVRGDGFRSRLVALVELILFVVLVSALFAGVIAAAALKIGHLGT